jgi:hypothetical protein
MTGEDYEARKRICEVYFQKNKNIDFQFTNQSWGLIGRTICDTEFLDLSKCESIYSKDYQYLLQHHPIRPYSFAERRYLTYKSYDIRRD